MPIYLSASSRLHALLSALTAVDSSKSLRHGWSQALGIPELDVQLGHPGLPSVAELVADAGKEALRAEQRVGLPRRGELIEQWARPVYAPGTNLDVPIHKHPVSREALNYLDAVASVLRTNESHHALPSESDLSDLLEQVSELVSAVETCAELPDDVKQALLLRIAQVRFAIETARVGGASGVGNSVELLLGAVVVRNRYVPGAMARKFFVVASAAFALFSAGPTVQASLEAWPQVFETLGLGPGEMQTSNGVHDQLEQAPARANAQQ